MVAQELEEIANKLISSADVNKQVLPNIPRELVEYVHSALPPLSARSLTALTALRVHLRSSPATQIAACCLSWIIRTLATTAAHEMSPVCAVVGGLLAQDILKALAAREPPIANFFTFDGNLGGGTVVRMSMP